VKIEIKDEICEEIRKRVEESEEFSSVEEYVNFILEEVIKDENEGEGTIYTEEEEKQIKERLRDLGYM
jgi:Arc/MetJ-type ribon-helix-helix transcriptional regulator